MQQLQQQLLLQMQSWTLSFRVDMRIVWKGEEFKEVQILLGKHKELENKPLQQETMQEWS
jgi:hypothetical protein